MYPCCVLALLCALCAGCSPRPSASFGFVDGRPIYAIRESTREECQRAAESRCGGSFTILEEGPAPRHRSGWVDIGKRQIETDYSLRVKCDSH